MVCSMDEMKKLNDLFVENDATMIIKLHPMPFCVLDEVDAPLDEKNANIYAEYLKKFSKDTQFIIISHRKPTMELADELYGITMQEKGVSKFYTVKLSDALKMAK